MKKLILIFTFVAVVGLMAQEDDVKARDEKRIKELTAEIKLLEKKLSDLEERLEQIESDTETVTKAVKNRDYRRYQQALAAKRMQKDAEVYSAEEQDEIEKLYQAGVGRWATKDGSQSLKELLSKYPKANRTGCAVLMTGEASRGSDKEEYLKKSIKEYSDCFLDDGISVGAWGRFQLGQHYEREGEEKQARKLYREILEKYPDAIDRRGRPLSVYVEKRL